MCRFGTLSTPRPWGAPIGLGHPGGSRGAVCAAGWIWGTEAQLVPAPQAIRTPSRGEAGLELLMAYYNQLCFLDARFVTPTRSLGLLFQW